MSEEANALSEKQEKILESMGYHEMFDFMEVTYIVYIVCYNVNTGFL